MLLFHIPLKIYVSSKQKRTRVFMQCHILFKVHSELSYCNLYLIFFNTIQLQSIQAHSQNFFQLRLQILELCIAVFSIAALQSCVHANISYQAVLDNLTFLVQTCTDLLQNYTWEAIWKKNGTDTISYQLYPNIFTPEKIGLRIKPPIQQYRQLGCCCSHVLNYFEPSSVF